MTYEIKYEPVTIEDITYPQYNIYYYGGDLDTLKEFHSTDGVNGTIRQGYTKKIDISTIEKYKEYLIDLIDEKTEKIILTEGFVFDEITFSLSKHAQTNISNLPNAKDEKFPMPYLGKNDEYYVLTLAKKMDFYYTAFDTIANIRIANGVIKLQVKACTTTEELDIIKQQNNL